MKLSFQFLWYDLWVGAYWSKESRALYVCPFFCCCFKLQFP